MFVVTKLGFVHLYVESGTYLKLDHLSGETMFVSEGRRYHWSRAKCLVVCRNEVTTVLYLLRYTE